ncbi:K(+)/H(+) antiporter subunit KhtU [Abditibacteriota bacterium]|nr:K(+)/H(+) antiporter subunit KhtU [Abditibacteriota bacterium]
MASSPDHSPTEALSHVAALFIELGAVVLGLSALARLALKIGLTPIPFYLIAGVFFGTGGVHPLLRSNEYIGTSSEIGVVLLLFVLGLEYNGAELSEGLKRGFKSGVLDMALNFVPGFVFGLLLGLGVVGAILLGGVTWVTASSIVSKVLGDLDRLGNRETPVVLSILVLEDLAMAVYLPLIAVLLLGLGFVQGAVSIGVALLTVGVVLVLALRFGERLSNAVAHSSSEVVLLTVFGLVLVVAGIAQKLQVSAAIGAFLTGLALEGRIAERARDLLSPLRDLFATTFFFFVGMSINPQSLPGAAGPALGLAVVTTLTKTATGILAARREGIAKRGQLRAGLALVPRGEFSVVIAGLGAGVAPQLAPISAAYVLILAIAGPILTRYADSISDALERFQERREAARLQAIALPEVEE